MTEELNAIQLHWFAEPNKRLTPAFKRLFQPVSPFFVVEEYLSWEAALAVIRVVATRGDDSDRVMVRSVARAFFDALRTSTKELNLGNNNPWGDSIAMITSLALRRAGPPENMQSTLDGVWSGFSASMYRQTAAAMGKLLPEAEKELALAGPASCYVIFRVALGDEELQAELLKSISTREYITALEDPTKAQGISRCMRYLQGERLTQPPLTDISYPPKNEPSYSRDVKVPNNAYPKGLATLLDRQAVVSGLGQVLEKTSKWAKSAAPKRKIAPRPCTVRAVVLGPSQAGKSIFIETLSLALNYGCKLQIHTPKVFAIGALQSDDGIALRSSGSSLSTTRKGSAVEASQTDSLKTAATPSLTTHDRPPAVASEAEQNANSFAQSLTPWHLPDNLKIKAPNDTLLRYEASYRYEREDLPFELIDHRGGALSDLAAEQAPVDPRSKPDLIPLVEALTGASLILLTFSPSMLFGKDRTYLTKRILAYQQLVHNAVEPKEGRRPCMIAILFTKCDEYGLRLDSQRLFQDPDRLYEYFRGTSNVPKFETRTADQKALSEILWNSTSSLWNTLRQYCDICYINAFLVSALPFGVEKPAWEQSGVLQVFADFDEHMRHVLKQPAIRT